MTDPNLHIFLHQEFVAYTLLWLFIGMTLQTVILLVAWLLGRVWFKRKGSRASVCQVFYTCPRCSTRAIIPVPIRLR